MSKRDDWLNDWDDAPDYIRERMQRRPRRIPAFTRAHFYIAGLGFVLFVTFYVLAQHLPLGSLAKPEPDPIASSVTPTPPPPEPYRPSQPLEPSSTTLTPPTPQPLDDCIQSGNVIDESVVRCRYGELPRATEPPSPPQGMVSAEYLENFRNERDSRISSGPSGSSVEHDAQWIRKWSGGAQYLAEWQIRNNRIDGTSVCANHKRGSIDYRECRKGAKHFFKEQCRAWGERWESDREAWSKQMEQRYCSAGNGFNPIG